MGNHSETIKRMKETIRKRVLKYFKYCPLCFDADSIEFDLRPFGRDSIFCSSCGAKWHIYITAGIGFKWAELEKENVEGKGTELIRVKHEPEFWQQMALKGRRLIKETPAQVVKEKEVIREKEVIVKVRCPYCNKLYDEILDICPHCGGKR